MKRTPLKRGGPLKRGKPLRRVSEKQKSKLEAWAEIKRKKMLEQIAEMGFNFCEACGVQTNSLDLDHIVPAGRGGTWTADNAQLLGRLPGPCECHQRGKHRNYPEWGDRPVEKIVLRDGIL